MEIIGVLTILFAFIISVTAYYYMFNISLAIWKPEKSKKKWLVIANLPMIKDSFLMKWVVPFMLVLITLSLIIELIRYILV